MVNQFELTLKVDIAILRGKCVQRNCTLSLDSGTEPGQSRLWLCPQIPCPTSNRPDEVALWARSILWLVCLTPLP